MHKIVIQNLKCGGCANTIKTKIGELEKVQSVDVDVESSTVTVNVLEDSILEKIKTRLSDLGYPAQDQENSFGKKTKSYVSCAIGKMSS